MPTPLKHDEPPWPNPAYAWYVIAVLTLAYTVSFVDRQMLSLLVGPIQRDLGISYTRISLLQGVAFALFYTILGLPIGRLADRRSRRGIIAVGIAVWSIMTMACGLARSFWALFAARMGVGVGEAALSPPAYSIVADYFPPEKLARAMSFYSMGIYIGAGLAFIVGGGVVSLVSGADGWVLPIIGEVFAWQVTFFAIGLPGLAVVALVATIREPARRGLMTAKASATAPPQIPLRQVVAFILGRGRAYILLFVGIAMIAMAGYGTSAWVPEFAVQTFAMTASEIGYYYGAAILVFSVSGVLSAGWLADRLAARGHRDAALRIMIGAAVVVAIFGTLAPLAPNRMWLAILGIPVVFASAMPFGIGPAAIQLITPNQMRAQVSAIYLFVVNIIGLGLGPWVVAFLTDYVFGYHQALKYALSILHLGAAPVAVVCLWLALKPYRRADEEAENWRPTP